MAFKISGVVVNVSLLLEAIEVKGYRGVDEASRACRVAPGSINKLLRFDGTLPRLDSIQRICRGLDISVKELIVASSPKTTQGKVLPGRWGDKTVAAHHG